MSATVPTVPEHHTAEYWLKKEERKELERVNGTADAFEAAIASETVFEEFDTINNYNNMAKKDNVMIEFAHSRRDVVDMLSFNKSFGKNKTVESMISYIDFQRCDTQLFMKKIQSTSQRQDFIDNISNNIEKCFQYLQSHFCYIALSSNICQIKVHSPFEWNEVHLVFPLFCENGETLIYGICEKREKRKWIVTKMFSLNELCDYYYNVSQKHSSENKDFKTLDMTSFKDNIKNGLNNHKRLFESFSSFNPNIPIIISPNLINALQNYTDKNNGKNGNKNYSYKRNDKKGEYWLNICQTFNVTWLDLIKKIEETAQYARFNPSIIKYQINANAKQGRFSVECVIPMQLGYDIVGWPIVLHKKSQKYEIISSLTPQMFEHNCFLFDSIMMKPNNENKVDWSNMGGFDNDSSVNPYKTKVQSMPISSTVSFASSSNSNSNGNECNSSNNNNSSNNDSEDGYYERLTQIRVIATQDAMKAQKTLSLINLLAMNMPSEWKKQYCELMNARKFTMDQIKWDSKVIEMTNNNEKNVDLKECVNICMKAFNLSVMCGASMTRIWNVKM